MSRNNLDKTKEFPATGFPVNMLLSGRLCIVVGGGKISFRKISHLLDAEAKVHLISPDVCKEVQGLIDNNQISHTAREFEESDVKSAALVFAATNDRYINKGILASCRKHNVLCASVDGNWMDGDFTTPAMIRQGNLTVSVSTGGRSCRQARLIKDNLAKHLRMIETADLVVVGTDHRLLSLTDREPFHLTGDRYDRIGWMIMQLWGVHEFMILNTCNRIEVIAIVSRETSQNGILRHVLGFDKLRDDQFYLKHGMDAYEHISLVISGMLSQTPGEYHVASQVKNALEVSKNSGWSGSMMQQCVSSFLHVSKHIKKDVSPLLNNDEIEDLALKYLKTEVPKLSEKTVMVLGAGMVGKGLVKECLNEVGRIIWCYHINRPELSEDDLRSIELCTFNEIKDRIGEADIIISAVDAPGQVLHCGHEPFFNQEKKVHLIDLGMPRNIASELDNLSPDISVVDLDGLKHWYRNELTDMDSILSRCRNIINEHQELYENIVQSFQGRNASESAGVNTNS